METFFKEKRFKSEKYLEAIRKLPCLACATPLDVCAHHLRHVGGRGMGLKAPDNWAVPLCGPCHLDCHKTGNEAAWWLGKAGPVEWASTHYEEWRNEG